MENLPKKVRSKKLSSRVDLTAMVSISFLLIIFFMVVGELAKPKVMNLSLPDNNPICGEQFGSRRFGGCGENQILTILLGDNNKLVLYMRLLQSPINPPKELQYGKDGIRKELFKRKKNIIEHSSKMSKSENLVVIIKPSKKSNYKNLVDILDEMAIAKIDNYLIVNDFSPEESKLLATK